MGILDQASMHELALVRASNLSSTYRFDCLLQYIE